MRGSPRAGAAARADLLLVASVTVANGLLARVAERRQELAARSALGAPRSTLVRAATHDAMRAVVLGTAAGLAAAYAGAMLLAPFLFRVAPRAPAPYAVVALLVAGVAALAAWGPVLRFDRASVAGMLKTE